MRCASCGDRIRSTEPVALVADAGGEWSVVLHAGACVFVMLDHLATEHDVRPVVEGVPAA